MEVQNKPMNSKTRGSGYNPTSFPDFINFNSPYFTTQLSTYIGNKRGLLPFINQGVQKIKKKLSKKKLITLDGFSGSGSVARLLKYHSNQLWVNDFEDYCEVLNKCYLANKSEIDFDYIMETIKSLNRNRLNNHKKIGFIERNYAPKDDYNIQPGERVFYTNRNAKIIDNLKRLINTKISNDYRHFFLASLLVQASIHTNTSGVFKGFHKRGGVGHFGGRGENALGRIKGEIKLEVPVFSEVECKVNIKKVDINKLINSSELPDEFDLVYYDPPYNQHPYGSNYFMLNIIANEPDEFEIQNGVSGIIKDWKRSDYNRRQKAELAMDNLLANTRAKYILISYNNEGLIPVNTFGRILRRYGDFTLMKREYNTYRGSRNLRQRDIKVTELLWILKRK